jgi:hypothetical protein
MMLNQAAISFRLLTMVPHVARQVRFFRGTRSQRVASFQVRLNFIEE